MGAHPFMEQSAPPAEPWYDIMSRKNQNWIRKHKHDHFYRKAKQNGHRSRAAYKLKQIDDKFNIFHKGDIVLDLGCSPGGWTQVAVERTGAEGTVIGVDRDPMRPVEGARFIRGDITKERTRQQLRKVLREAVASTGSEGADRDASGEGEGESEGESEGEGEGESEGEGVAEVEVEVEVEVKAKAETEADGVPAASAEEPTVEGKAAPLADCVISDMSPNISGIYSMDQARSVYLVEHAFQIAVEFVHPGGNFVAKVFEGADFEELYHRLKRKFGSFRTFSPAASRKSSSEKYLLGKGLKPQD